MVVSLLEDLNVLWVGERLSKCGALIAQINQISQINVIGTNKHDKAS